MAGLILRKKGYKQMRMPIDEYIYGNIYIHTTMNLNMTTYVDICSHMHMCTYLHVRTNARTHVHVVFMCLQQELIYISTRIHTCIDTYMRLLLLLLRVLVLPLLLVLLLGFMPPKKNLVNPKGALAKVNMAF